MANPVREAGEVVPFPAERLLVAHGPRHEIVVIQDGQARLYATRAALRDALFPGALTPAPVAVGDQVAVTHQGVTRTFETYEVLFERMAFEARLRRGPDRHAHIHDAPWAARLQFLVAERAGILLGAIAAGAVILLEHLS